MEARPNSIFADTRRDTMKINKQIQPMLATALASLKPLNLRQLLLTQPAPVLFGQALTRALKCRRFRTRAATQRSYRRAAGQLPAVFGARDIHTISLADYEAFVASLHRATGEPLSGATKNFYIFLNRLAVHEAGLCTPMPRRFPVQRRVPLFYTQGEIGQMIAAVRPEERGYVIVQSHFGLRPGEALRLQPEHINLSDQTIRLGGAITKGLVRVIQGRHGTSDLEPNVPGGAWRLLAAFPFRPLQRSPRTVHEIMHRAAGGWIPGGLRLTAAANLITLTGQYRAAKILGVQTRMLTKHFMHPMTSEQARDYFDLDPGQFAQTAA
jgi:integrase